MAEADYEKKSVNEIIQALDALSRTLSQARANRRTSPRSARSLSRSASSKDGGNGAAADAVTPRALFRSASSKDRTVDASAAGEASPRPWIVQRRSSAPTSPFRAKPTTLDKIENAEEEDDSADSAHSEQLKSQGFAAVTPAEVAAAEVEEKKEARGPVHAPSRNGMRRMGCLCSVEVVAAQGLPPSTDGLRLAVTVRKKETRDGAVQTMTARVQLGAADFDEALYVRCHLYGTGAAGGKPASFEPRPFLLSLVVDAPELDMGRSTVDLSLFAKEFTEKCQQGESFQQWDMTIPLAGKAKGGQLVVKLAFQSIVDESAPKMTRTRTLKVDVPAPDLRGVDGFKLDDLEAESSPIEEVKEMQQKEPERAPADEHAPVVEVKEEEQEKESDHKRAGEPTPVAEVNEEQQKEQELEPADELTLVAEVKEGEQQKEPEAADEPIPATDVKEEQQKEPEAADELIPVADMKEEEQHKELERSPTDDEHTPMVEVKEEGQLKGLEHEPVNDEHTPVIEVKQEEQWKELEYGTVDEPTPLVEVKEEKQQKELECEPVDEPNLVAEVKEEEEEKQKERESEPADEPTPVVKVEEEQQKELEGKQAHETTLVVKLEEEEKQKELESEPADEPTLVAKVNEEEQQKDPEHELEDAQEDDDSEVPKSDVIDKGVDEQEGKAELSEEVDTNKEIDEEEKEEKDEEENVSLTSSDEVAKTVANGLEEKSVEETMPNDVSGGAVEVVELMDDAAALLEDVTRESLQVAEQGGDKRASVKPSRPPLKWRTVALLVPVSVLFSKTLGANLAGKY